MGSGPSCGGTSGSVGTLFVFSSGRGTDVATGVSWGDSGSGRETGDEAELNGGISSGGGSSEGVRKSPFEGSASSDDETRRLESVGDASGFTLTGNSCWSEPDDWDSLAEDSVPEDRRPSTPLSAGTGLRTLDRFRLGRGGGLSALGPAELGRSGGATKRRFSGSGSARLSLSPSPQPGTRSKPKDEATPQKPVLLVFLRGGMGGLLTFAPSISR